LLNEILFINKLLGSKPTYLVQNILKFCVVIFAFTNAFAIHAQMVGTAAVAFKNLKLHDKPPKYLLSKKSAVFISVPPSANDKNEREDWQKFSKELHGPFKKMGIDAVAYYYLDDLFANPDVNEAFTRQLVKRDFKYIILVEHTRNSFNPDLDNHYRFTVAPFNDENTFIAEGANAWRVEGPSLNTLLTRMSKDIYRQEMKFSNYLIPDNPEFFDDVEIFKGRKIPTYAMDLKVEPLIVPKFQKFTSKDSSKMDQAVLNKIRKFNQSVNQKNRRLEQIMSTYPLKYEISDNYTDTDVYNKGGQFLLQNMTASGGTILDLLNDTSNDSTILVSKTAMGQVPLSREAVVTKFYVKHVFAKDVYTGLGWEAGLTWEEALENFIFNMKDILKVK